MPYSFPHNTLLPYNLLCSLRKLHDSRSEEFSVVFKACLIPLRELPSINTIEDALSKFARSQWFVSAAARTYENRFYRHLNYEDFDSIYRALLEQAFEIAGDQIYKDDSDSYHVFDSDVVPAIHESVSTISQYLCVLTSDTKPFPSIKDLNNKVLTKMILEQLARSELFSNCDIDVYELIRKALSEVFFQYEVILEKEVFNNNLADLKSNCLCMSDFTLREYYEEMMAMESYYYINPEMLQLLPEELIGEFGYDIGAICPQKIKAAFINGFGGFFKEESWEEKFDLLLSSVFENKFTEKFKLTPRQFAELISKSDELCPEKRTRLCKSNLIASQFLLQVTEQSARQYVNLVFYKFLNKFNLSASAFPWELMHYELQRYTERLCDRHNNGAGLSGLFVWKPFEAPRRDVPSPSLSV